MQAAIAKVKSAQNEAQISEKKQSADALLKFLSLNKSSDEAEVQSGRRMSDPETNVKGETRPGEDDSPQGSSKNGKVVNSTGSEAQASDVEAKSGSLS